MTNPLPPADPGHKNSKLPLILGIVAAVILGIVFVVGILGALGVYGMRKYLSAAKESEGRAGVARIARGAIQCAERERLTNIHPAPQELPNSAGPVPSALHAVSGKKYMSTPGEWKSPAWDCIGFQMVTPQYFQYQWERATPTEGVARAVADLDGDGAPDVTFEVPVSCSTSPSFRCTADPVREKR